MGETRNPSKRPRLCSKNPKETVENPSPISNLKTRFLEQASDSNAETMEASQSPSTISSEGRLRFRRSIDEFERLNKIGEGTYGVVYRARDRITGEIVALKRLKMEKEGRKGFPWRREIDCLARCCRHPSIVELKEVVLADKSDHVFLVMEYCDHDLDRVMKKRKQPMCESEVRQLMRQLFRGIQCLHKHQFLHRDLKPSNILLNELGEVKICDFGLCTKIGNLPYTQPVVTLWYRAPELLSGAENYSTAIDMWSSGCIMAELLANEPLFCGQSEFDQLSKIFRVLGTPNEDMLPGFAGHLGAPFPRSRRSCSKLREKFPATAFSGRPTLSKSGFELLSALLNYDPEKRMTADAALKHPWFSEAPAAAPVEIAFPFHMQDANGRYRDTDDFALNCDLPSPYFYV
uniref:[RNA-polymerase]-subunit kinase n=1 Tax=Ananas comosus var. bracteatus TaxID=296719 RepID=A0A6V7P5P1_ANACO|nr:unnamed protein product [Ananas comosus var. bracteatus]